MVRVSVLNKLDFECQLCLHSQSQVKHDSQHYVLEFTFRLILTHALLQIEIINKPVTIYCINSSENMKTILTLLICLFLLNSSIAFSAPQQNPYPLEKVSLQLKWLHQFQFAGYYAAKEQGYYAAEGLDVTIFERSLDKDFIEQVVSGDKDFGVGDSGILSYYARGEPIVALAAIFQHNPLVFIAKQSSGIISPYEMSGKRIMFDSMGMDDSVLQAVLEEAHLTEINYTTVKQSFRNDDLIENKIDVMSGYLSDAIFYFQQKKININIINPQNYGIDFYGDLLFTSQHELTQHQGRAEKFRRASLKGWQYALDHPEELIQLIHKKYHSRLSLAHLHFEAEVTRKLILPDVIPLGQINAERMRKVADVYAQLKLSKPLSERRLAQFINPFNRSDDKPLIVGSEQDFPPLVLGKTDATADGFTVELWRAVAAEVHLNSTIRVLPWNQVLEEFKAGKSDVLINLALSNERREFADFSVPHVVLNGAIFVRDDENTIHSEADIKNKQLIVVKDDLAPEYLQKKGWDEQIIEVDTVEAGLKLLADGHYDAMLVSKLVGKKTLEKLNIRTIKMLAIDIDLTQKFSFAVHKGDAELLAKINEGLAITKANGTYDKLYEKWFGVYEEKQLLPLVIKYLTRIIIVFLFILLLIFYRHHIERKQATKQLSQRERHLRAILDLSPECIKLVARDGTLLSMNPTGLAIIEAGSEDEVRNNSVYPIIAPEYRAAFQAFNEDICDGKSGNMEFEVLDLKGVKHWMVTHAVPLKLENGDRVQLAFSQEITERKHIEERLRILSVAIEQSPTSIMISDLKGDLLYVNPRFTEVTGYSAEEAIGRNPSLLQSGLTPKEVYKQLWDSLTHGKVWQGELINRHKDGHFYWEDVHIAPVKDLSGVITHYVGVKLDITARKQSEEALRDSEFRWKFAIEGSGDGVWDWDIQTNEALYSKLWKEMLGYSENDILPSNNEWVTRIHPDDKAYVAETMQAYLQGKTKIYIVEYRLRCKDESYKWILGRGMAVSYSEEGKPLRMIGTHTDITDRKRAEKYNQCRNIILELLASDEPLARVFEAIVLGVEQLNPEMMCSILLLDNEGKHLLNGAAPSLPDFYNNAVNGIEIGVGMGSCGTAAFINERVIVADIKTHPYWAPYKDLATRAGLGACWSQPIRSSTAQVLGTFAIYHHSNHTPTDDDIQLIEQSANFVSIAIEKSLATEKLRASEQRFRHFFERNSSVMMLIEPKSGQIEDANKAAANYYGYTVAQLICMNISDINTLSPLTITEEKRLALQETHTDFNFRHRLASGEIRAVEVHSTPIENNDHPLLFSIVHDITDRTLAEVQLRIAATVFEAQEGMLITDANNVIIKVNNAFTQITGYSMAEVIGKNPRLLKSGKQDKAFYTALWQSVNDTGAWQGELWNRRKNGEIYPEWTTITAVKSSNDNAITHYVATLTDITERKAAEEKIQQLAFYDPLTVLPNRRKLLDRLEYSIALNQRANSQFAVFMMDLDKFKAVNDKLGHAAGDELLKQVAQRITGCLRNSDMVARLGGDEFVLVLENLKIPEAAETVALKVIADLTIPFQLSETDCVQIGASIGISIYPQHGITPEKLMDHADTALYQAKDNGRGCFSHFSGSESSLL